MHHLTLDDRGIPTGKTSSWPHTSETLGTNVFDDGFDEVADGAVFALSGGGCRIEVTRVAVVRVLRAAEHR
jgi:hypothetical protein